MLDGGLTHMNGRLYDPTLSRFVSADPYVDNPYDLQSLNRYSYVWNNPLGYTDPSGYFGFEISPSLGRGLFMLGGIMFGAVLGPAGPIFAGGGFATTIASGALAGGVGGFIGSGGNAQAARQGALAGGLFAGAGQLGNKLGLANNSVGRAALHAGAGCISASAGGGSCGSGAMQAGFTKFASSNLPDYGDFGNLVKYAVIGGTAAEIGGGKFANGAMTGAWQYLVNAAVSRSQNPAQSIADKALQNRHLSLSEANKIWRANNDPNFSLSVDASQLSIKQIGDFRADGTVEGRVLGMDWFIHGTVTLNRDSLGSIYILPEPYDFLPRGSFWDNPGRNLETYGGFWGASRAGTSVGTDFLIKFSGQPNVKQ